MKIPAFFKRRWRPYPRCLPAEAIFSCLLLSSSLLASIQNHSTRPACYQEFEQRILKSLQADDNVDRIAEALRSSLPFSQQLVRDTFRTFPAAVSSGNQAESASLKEKLAAVYQAWKRAFPDLPIPAALPAALGWSLPLHRRYAAAQTATQDAQQLYNHGEFQKAQRMWHQALSEFEQLGAAFATSYLHMNLGLCAYEFGDMKKAQVLLLKAKAIHEQYRHSSGIRDVLMNLSMVAEIQSRYAEGRELLLQARQINSSLCDDATEARILSSLGVIASESGRLSEAEQYYLSARAIRRRAGDQEGEATDTNNLGVVYYSQGLLPQALECYRQSLAIRTRLQDIEGQADSLLNLSDALAAMGRLEESLALCYKALHIFDRLGSPQRTVTAWTQAGDYYLKLGLNTQAESLLRGALELAQKHAIPASAAYLNGRLASLALTQRNFPLADALLQEAMELTHQVGDTNEQCQLLLDLGKLNARRDDRATSAFYLLQALGCATDEGLGEILVEAFQEMGQLALDQQRPGIAAHYFGTSAKLAGIRCLADREWRAENFLSRAYLNANRHEAARWHLKRALEMVLKMEQQIPLVSVALHYWDDKAEIFRQMSRLAEMKGSPISSWAWADLMKARLVKRRNSVPDATVQAQVNPPPNIPDDSVRRELRELYLNLSRTSPSEPVRRAELQFRIESLEAAQPSSLLLADPLTANSGFSTPEASLQRLQRRLSDSEALVDFLVHPDSLRAWIITRTGFQTLEIALAESELRQLMEAAGLGADPQNAAATAERRLAINFVDPGALRKLAQRIWLPLAHQLPRQARTLIFIPDGALHLLPFEILPHLVQQQENEHGLPARYLLHDFAISYLPAATLLEPTIPLADPGRLQVVALGSRAEVIPLKISKAPAEPGPGEIAGARTTELTPGQDGRIGGEMETLRRLFPASHAYSWPDKRTRGSFLQAAGESDLLHIASHYQYDPQRPEFSRFALDLSAAGQIAWEPMYAFEVAALKFRSAMTVLSACSTGRGELHPGEGLANMGRALLLAGSRSVITSMWPVEEESTAALMQNFYQLLAAGLDSREALRQAKLRVFSSPRWRHPYYWGAFTLSGSAVRIVLSGKKPAPAGIASLEPSALWIAIAAAAGMLGAQRSRRHRPDNGALRRGEMRRRRR